jgi:hypothetical protein
MLAFEVVMFAWCERVGTAQPEGLLEAANA